MIPVRSVSVLYYTKAYILPDQTTGLAVLKHIRQGTNDKLVGTLPGAMRGQAQELPAAFRAAFLQRAQSQGTLERVIRDEDVWQQLEAKGQVEASFQHREFGPMSFRLKPFEADSSQRTISFEQQGQEGECPLDAQVESQFNLAMVTSGTSVTLETVAVCDAVASVDLAVLLGKLPQRKGFSHTPLLRVMAGVLKGDDGDVLVATEAKGDLRVSLEFGNFITGFDGSKINFEPGQEVVDTRGVDLDSMGMSDVGDALRVTSSLAEEGLQIALSVRKEDKTIIHRPAQVQLVRDLTAEIQAAYQPWVVG